ncbi:MAG TPA: hypothetical protein VGG06_35940 [Thermoanaerobaculia bacterium]
MDEKQTGPLEEQFRTDVNWFFCVAALSAFNSVGWFFNVDWIFAIGLGISQLFHGIMLGMTTGASADSQMVGQVVSLVLGLVAAGFFALLGVFSRKEIAPVYVLGMVLYGLDGVLLLLFQDWLGVGVHVLALLYLARGYQTIRKLKEIGSAMPSPELVNV